MQKSWKGGLVFCAVLTVLAGWAATGSVGQVVAPTTQPAVAASGANTAIVPVPRSESEFWVRRHEAMNERVKQGNVDLVFIGDSITQGWEGAGKEVWAERYAKRNAVNLGISGDRTQHVLWRLDHGNIDGIRPKVAVVMIGTNNSNREDHTVAQIAEGVTAIVKRLRERLPETKILLVAIFPRGAEPNNQRGKILQVNQIINRLADNQHVWFVDFGYKFVDENGNIPKSLMPDYLHLTKEGYQIWADSIEAKLAELMGEK